MSFFNLKMIKNMYLMDNMKQLVENLFDISLWRKVYRQDKFENTSKF